ncbi:peptide chain release factor aRF-1 [Candidatus Woesearchaeota archaeon]|nr:peptide chain release factor aRF-1 [Candidatus Woesearchaeota archaeon]
MSMSSKERFELKKFIKDIQDFRGRHTELVSVYVPSGYDLNKVVNQLVQEQGTATNIKSTSTRKNVIDALERMIQHLRLFPRTPDHGLAAFAGNVSEREGQSDVQVFSIEPPIPLNIRIYRCDKQFVLEPLQDMVAIKEGYGLVVMDRREADIAMLRGKSIITLSQASSNVPGKTKAGGQSAARYMRIREDAAKDFYKKIADMMKEAFLGNENIKGIIMGGPGPTKYELIDSGYITGDVQKLIIATKDLSYTGPFGVQELVDRSQDVLANEELAEEKNAMERFFKQLHTNAKMVSYGETQVEHMLKMGAVDVLLISESCDDEVIERLEKLAVELGSDIKIISTETREGVQLRDMGKIAAILRYEAETD